MDKGTVVKYRKMSKSRSSTNKPPWRQAPRWANYLAMDFDGEWQWHQLEPIMSPDRCWDSGGMSTHAASASDLDREMDWTTTLEARK